MTIDTERTPGRAAGRGRRLRVAVVGADGAGKSTVTARLAAGSLPLPTKRIYMGVNLEASSLMLPTTRLLLAAKRARGSRPDLVASPLGGPSAAGNRGLTQEAKDVARMTVWILEEWLRHAVATAYGIRGYVVVFDRHFFADYYFADVQTSVRGPARRVHGWLLHRVYPKPDLVVCLDAPAAVLHARKPESTPEWLEERRRQYLALEPVVPAFKVVDADRPLDEVTRDVVETVLEHWRGTP